MQNVSGNQANPEVPINENFTSLGWAACLTNNPVTTSGLTLGYYGGYWGGLTISNGTVALTGSTTNYVVVNRVTGAVTTATTTTNWNKFDTYARMFEVVTGTATITTLKARHGGLAGAHGYVVVPLAHSTTATTSGTSIDVNSFPPGINRVTLSFDGVSTNGTSRVMIQLADSGGVETNLYVGAVTEINATTQNFATSNNGALLPGTTAGTKRYGQIIIMRHDSGYGYSISGNLYAEDGASGTMGTTVCHKNIDSDLTAVRLTTVGGSDTFDAGSVAVFFA
jgi:hypothetical protein